MVAAMKRRFAADDVFDEEVYDPAYFPRKVVRDGKGLRVPVQLTDGMPSDGLRRGCVLRCLAARTIGHIKWPPSPMRRSRMRGGEPRTPMRRATHGFRTHGVDRVHGLRPLRRLERARATHTSGGFSGVPRPTTVSRIRLRLRTCGRARLGKSPAGRSREKGVDYTFCRRAGREDRCGLPRGYDVGRCGSPARSGQGSGVCCRACGRDG